MYKNILNYPKFVILIISTILLFSFYFAKNFKLDASAETLLLENDPDLTYLRKINERYGSEEFFILTYEPKSSIKKETILELENFVKKINNFHWVSKTVSIINTPLLNNSNEPIQQRISNLKYITSPDVNFDNAISELVMSPVYKNLIISEDQKTLGIIVYLKDNKDLIDAKNIKAKILGDSASIKTNFNNKQELRNIEKKIEKIKKIQGESISKYNQAIKDLIKNQSKIAEIRLSGIPMIADDMITFIKNDIVIFGIGVFLFIIIILWLIFKNIKWVFFPLINCLVSIIFMMGLLGFLEWKVTVISSNFIALMLILTISMNIHYQVRFIQLKDQFPNVTLQEIILKTSSNIFFPILYAVLTTICAFLSLVFSDIKPVIDFGWMMTFALLSSFALSFFLLPSLISIFYPTTFKLSKENKSIFANMLAVLSIKYPRYIYASALLMIIFSVYGITNLKVENSFINYFSSKTEIYKGMKKIDEKLGGTTPLEIIIKFKKNIIKDNNDEFLGSVKKKDDFLGEDQEKQSSNKYKYWFTKDKIDKIINIHKYLEQNPFIGKVLSFASIVEIAKNLNDNKELSSLEMGILYDKLPENIKKNIITPYISVADDEARISMRIYDSNPELRRKELIKRINYDLENKFLLKKDEFKVTGILVIFNNLLQSLFDSQIKSLGLVMIAIFLMFVILFKSFLYAIIGTVPNFIAAFFILGFIGSLNIPLDMMTITIAAIAIGIAVDNSIHYIYRFKEEINLGKNKFDAINLCHQSVGKAIISTTVTIIFGFSILSFSNFIPTIYFGVFTGMAMMTALMLVLTLLPTLLIKFSKS